MKVSKMFWAHYKNSLELQPECVFQSKDRCTGRTTAHCLKLIASAMENPCKAIRIYSEYPDTFEDRRRVFKGIQKICYLLKLDWFEFHHTNMSIKYNPYIEIKQKWVEVDND